MRANLVTFAEEEKHTKSRHLAVELAQKHGLFDKIDRYKMLIADLRYSPGCKNRRKSIAKLVALGDKRAIDEIWDARQRRGTIGKYKGVRLNRCMAREATTAIKKLRAMNTDAGVPSKTPPTAPNKKK